MISEANNQDSLPDPRIDVRVDGHLGSVIIKRDAARNALSRSMVDALTSALSDLHQEKRVRAVMVTGAGTAFCSGTDLKELLDSVDDEAALSQWFTDVHAIQQLYEKMLRFPKPIIAAVNGAALGTGLGLVLASDIVIGCEEASYGLPEATRGLSAAHVLPLLDFRVGAGKAAYLALTARVIDNPTATDLGIVHDSVSADLLWAHCSQLADELAQQPTEAATISKRAISEGIGEHLSTLLSTGAAAMATARSTESAIEGIRAFVEKREPNWP